MQEPAVLSRTRPKDTPGVASLGPTKQRNADGANRNKVYSKAHSTAKSRALSAGKSVEEAREHVWG